MAQTTRTLKQLGAALRRHRKLSGLTQAGLGDCVNKRQATISNLESADNGTLETLFAVLSALDLELVVQPRTKSDVRRLGDIF